MDVNRFMILLKGEDKTEMVQTYKVEGEHVWITFSISKTYRYRLTNFEIFQNPTVTELTEEMAVYANDIPLHNIAHIQNFGSKMRVISKDGKSDVYDSISIRVECTGISKGRAISTLDYWKVISRYTSSKDEERNKEKSFLKKQFDGLTFVSPRSVLSCYLKGDPIRVNRSVESDTIFPFRFNLSQKEALDQAVSSQISIIEGPPGTGKTQTILNILANLAIMQNKTVAVVSGNNAAVQNVKDKLEAQGYHFFVAALGNDKNKKQFFENPPQQDVSAWQSDIAEGELMAQINKMNGDLHRLMEVEKMKAKLQQKLSAYRLEREHFAAYYEQQEIDQIRRLSFYRQTPEKIISFIAEHQLKAERGRLGQLIYKARALFLYGFTDFTRLRKNEIEVILNFQREYYDLKVEQLGEQIDSLQHELDQGSFRSLQQNYQQISEQLFRHKLFKKYDQRASVKATASTYKRNFTKFVTHFPIMLSTTHSLRNCVPEHFLFDYVILDESSQVDLLTGALALSCCKNAIIVGDMKQLPHIVDQKIAKRLGDVGVDVDEPYDYFKHNLLSSMLALYGDTVPKVMLKEHYRCPPRIIEFCNQKYYRGELVAFTTESAEDQPLLIYHTVDGNHMREVTHGRKGRFNQRELDVIQHEVLVDLEAAIKSHSDIGFATPYRIQVEKASDQLVEEIESDTIHKYQGREKPTMILSTVLDCTRPGVTGLKFVNDPRMINVAVSRAQQRFILVTDKSFFRDYSSEIGDLIRYMEYSTLDDNVVESEIVSVFDLLYKEYSDKLRSFKEKIIHRSKNKSENIVWTLLSEILQDEAYEQLECSEQVYIRNLLRDKELKKLDERERQYVNNGASVDFVIFHRLDKFPVLAIEVDGFSYHENDPHQLERDRMKDHILDVYRLPILRLPTTGSREDEKIRGKLDIILNRGT